MRDYLLFIVKNALRSKRRALLTIASVALSSASLQSLWRSITRSTWLRLQLPARRFDW